MVAAANTDLQVQIYTLEQLQKNQLCSHKTGYLISASKLTVNFQTMKKKEDLGDQNLNYFHLLLQLLVTAKHGGSCHAVKVVLSL